MIDLVPRGVWGMPGPLGPAKVSRPARGLWLHHSTATVTDDGDAEVHDDVYGDARQIARTGVRRFGRASYSLFTSPAAPRGQVLEMQGSWIGAHTAGHNSSTWSLCVQGNFDRLHPDQDLLWTIAATAATGALEGWWTQPELLGGHRDAPGASTACPGRNLYRAIPSINKAAKRYYEEGDAMQPIPQPSWVSEDIIDDLLAAGVLEDRPDEEPLLIWRTLVFCHRTLKASGRGRGVSTADVRDMIAGTKLTP